MVRRARRPKMQVGLKRIDAAVDALLPLGFSKNAIVDTVKKLLKVYEGNEGWVFIEEAAYKLVIDDILEQQEREEEEKAGTEPSQPMAITDIPCNGETDDWKDISCVVGTSGAEEEQQATSSSPPRLRPPCYGWICEVAYVSDDDGFFENESLAETPVVSTGNDEGLSSRRPRQSRWDVPAV